MVMVGSLEWFILLGVSTVTESLALFLQIHVRCVLRLLVVCRLLLQVKVTPKHSEECKKLLTLMGVPYIEVSGG